MENEFNWHNVLFGAFGIALFQGIGAAIKYFLDRKDKNKQYEKNEQKTKELFDRILTDTVDIQNILTASLDDLNFKRISLIKFQNGGGYPQLGTPQKITILVEAHDEESSSIRNQYQNHTASPCTQRMLSQVLHNDGVLFVNTATEVADPVLKAYYTVNKIPEVALKTVAMIPETSVNSYGFMLYLKVEFKSPIDQDIANQTIVNLADTAERIKNIFTRFYEKK